MSEWIDRGSGVYTSFTTCRHAINEQPTGALVRFGGALEDDGFDRDDICVGGISWCPDCSGPTWELKSLDPLHVEPSILTTCHVHSQHHGFIRNGVWVPA